VTYTVRRWDNWSNHDGLTGLAGLEAMLNAELAVGRRLAQLVVQSEDILIVVLDDGSQSAAG
jgi:hypothetical protein